ncbi:MAG: hypothetical protein KDH88_09025 [Chromatiales bacterium]|nr:hypothetical protein [Chromatiales bacterium]
MVRSYSKRLLSPYRGQVQIVEAGSVRALTMDGELWEVQFRRPPVAEQRRESEVRGKPIRHHYIILGTIARDGTQNLGLPTLFNTAEVNRQLDELAHHLGEVKLPLPAADHFEYWLLDERDEAPLALIFSCTNAEQMALYPDSPEWSSLPAVRMTVAATVEEQKNGTPPVNYRVERLVNERAGWNPRASWFQRGPNETIRFPPLLLSEDWENESDHQLCQRYLWRKAPRLLMLHGLGRDDRVRLEQAARENVMEVQRFYPAYPDVADEKLMAAIRVEARLRSAR